MLHKELEIAPGVMEYNGSLYYTNPDKDGETGEVDVNNNPTFRRVVGTGSYNNGNMYDPNGGGKYVGPNYVSDDNTLMDRRDKRIYKEITNKSLYADNVFIVFYNEEQKYYCVKNDCGDCKFNGECGVVPRVEDVENNQPHILVSLDISSQEPTHVTLLSKEEAYYPLFRNRVAVELGIDRYISYMAGEKFYFDPEVSSEKSKAFWTWLSKFEWDYYDLWRYNNLVDKLRAGDVSVEQEVLNTTERYLDEIKEEMEHI